MSNHFVTIHVKGDDADTNAIIGIAINAALKEYDFKAPILVSRIHSDQIEIKYKQLSKIQPVTIVHNVTRTNKSELECAAENYGLDYQLLSVLEFIKAPGNFSDEERDRLVAATVEILTDNKMLKE